MKEFPKFLQQKSIDTPLGTMIALADDTALYFLQFSDAKNITQNVQRFETIPGCKISSGTTKIHELLEQELQGYFAGILQPFTVPIKPLGSDFQQSVWQAVQKIPYGIIGSYAQLAGAIGNSKAVRAVANAQAKNSIAIIIPCHRIIKSNGDLCGYNGGVERKKWLLEHERRCV